MVKGLSYFEKGMSLVISTPSYMEKTKNIE